SRRTCSGGPRATPSSSTTIPATRWDDQATGRAARARRHEHLPRDRWPDVVQRAQRLNLTHRPGRGVLRGGLSLSMSGFGFWSHDIGGFEGSPDPAVFKRWVAFGLLSSHSRLHGSQSYRVPWRFDTGDEEPGQSAVEVT